MYGKLAQWAICHIKTICSRPKLNRVKLKCTIFHKFWLSHTPCARRLLCIWHNLMIYFRKCITSWCLHVSVPGRTVLSVARNWGSNGFWYVLTHNGLNILSIQSDTANRPQPSPSVTTGSTACGPVSKAPAILCGPTGKTLRKHTFFFKKKQQP